jgi:hypothetical protein
VVASTVAEVREWMIAVGTVGATAVALFLGVFYPSFRRPHLWLEHDSDRSDLANHDRVTTFSGDAAHAIEWIRLRAVAKAGRRDAEDVEVIILDAEQILGDKEGRIISAPLHIAGHSLTWSNTNEAATCRIPAGASRYVDVVASKQGRPVETRLQLAPVTADDRDPIVGVEAIELEVLLTAREFGSARYRIRLDNTREPWANRYGSPVEVTLAPIGTRQRNWRNATSAARSIFNVMSEPDRAQDAGPGVATLRGVGRRPVVVSILAFVGLGLIAFLGFGVQVVAQMTAGDLAVAVGTLALAGFTAWLARSTRESTKAAIRAATASEAAVKAAIDNIDVDRQAVEAMRDQVEATGAPYVILVPPGNSGQETWMPRAQINERLCLSFKLRNLGTGPAIVSDIEIVDKRSGSPRVGPLERYRPVGATSEVAAWVPLLDWPDEQIDVTFKVRYTATSGTVYVTDGRGIASVQGFESHGYERQREGPRASE